MKTNSSRLLVGAHLSIAGGFDKAVHAGQELGCTTIQIFTKSNRQWKAKPITEQQATQFITAVAASSISPIVAHATYLINVASASTLVAQQSIKALIDELIRCDQLEIPYLVLHPGSYVTGTPEAGLERIIKNLNHVLDTSDSKTMILLELMAGQGTVLGNSFEQLAIIRNNLSDKKRVGICLDTCHAFAAGYDLRTKHTYEHVWKRFDAIIGLQHLKVIHCNDSKKGLGSHVDRHEHIGKGLLGSEAFALLFNDARFFDIPKILETPKSTKEPYTEDRMNLDTIYSLLTAQTKKKLLIEKK